MIIKETPWEKRNLGVDTSIEYYIDSNERWDEIRDEIGHHEERYQVMHIASGNSDVLMKSVQLGFVPIETNLRLAHNLDSIDLPKPLKRFELVTDCAEANAEETQQIMGIIRDGAMFSSDKVARDDHFGSETAGRRYAYWTKDVLDHGARMLRMNYKGRLFAFDVFIDQGNQTGDAFLGGVVPQFSTSGLGIMPVYYITKYAKEKGYKKITTGVSSNNISILKIHEMLGYKIENMSYCLIKHFQ